MPLPTRHSHELRTGLRRPAAALLLAATFLGLAACSARPIVSNQPLSPNGPPAVASVKQLPARTGEASSDRTTIILSFSGGGTRAAALSYGVLKALRDVPLPQQGNTRLLDAVDAISAVSGGRCSA